MASLIISFISSFLIALLIIKYNASHLHFMSDFEMDAVQKHHNQPVPRVGGLAIFFGIAIGISSRLYSEPNNMIFLYFLASCTPVFFIGFLEDITKNISIKIRFLSLGISGYIAIIVLDISIVRIGIPPVDYLLALPLISTLFTVIAITGLSNAYNIIDGFNGLASMVGILTLMALAYIAYIVGDNQQLFLCALSISAILGFFAWNYPNGNIFLGDGGAYLIGFLIAVISISLTMKHNQISPWFAVLVNGYPIIETLFTIYRRKIQKNKNPGHADAIHLHTLLFRRVLSASCQRNNLLEKNSRTSPYIWTLSSFGIIPAVLFWHSSKLLLISSILFSLIYINIYRKIVKFKTPKWLLSIQ